MMSTPTPTHRASPRRAALVAATALCSVLAAPLAHAEVVDRTLCVFDPSGAQGDVYGFAKSFQTEALSWGVRFELKAQTNEQVAAADYKTGQCDAAMLTGTRARAFVKSTGTIEAMGALPDYALLGSVIKTLASPKAGPLVGTKEHETVAIIPGGAVYLLVADRKLDSIGKLAGKKIATLTHDNASRTMVDVVGASMVAAEVGTFAGIFNNGRADACYAPAAAIRPLELSKGMSKGGGIVRFPLAQMTYQIVAHKDKLPEDFGNKARAWSAGRFDDTLNLARRAEKELPKALWIDIPEADKPGYADKFRDVRVKLRSSGVYDKQMLSLMRKLRCRKTATATECTAPVE